MVLIHGVEGIWWNPSILYISVSFVYNVLLSGNLSFACQENDDISFKPVVDHQPEGKHSKF